MPSGNDLAWMCDLRIASTNARFACSFIKLGLIPGDGGACLLPRMVGMAQHRRHGRRRGAIARPGPPATAAKRLPSSAPISP